MVSHSDVGAADLKKAIRNKSILFAGNARLKIYGTLHCASGKRMKKENRVFFVSEKEAIQNGFRPCGHCMREAYLKWRSHNSTKIPRVQF